MECLNQTSAAAQFFGILQCEIRCLLLQLFWISCMPGIYMIGRYYNKSNKQ